MVQSTWRPMLFACCRATSVRNWIAYAAHRPSSALPTRQPHRFFNTSCLTPFGPIPFARAAASKRIMSLLEEWWRSMPPVTRSYICLSVMTTGAVALEVITPLKLYLNWLLILHKAHVWRLFTNFLFFGNFSLDFLFHMFFLYRYCKMLETNSFRGRTADFLYMLLFGATLLVIVSPLTSIDFLGPSLTFMMVYVWGRRNSRQVVSFLGMLSFRAPYLPWVLLVFSFVLGSTPSMDLLGILAGHVYYYMADVYPAMTGVSLLKTPRLLQILVGNNDDYDRPYEDFAQEPQAANQQNGGGAGWGQGRLLDGGGRQ